MRAPFLGGFDVPRPQLVDINGDGKLDLFVQERSGELMYFEREGDEWVWKSDRFQNIDVGEWYRFVDIDRDGDADLFAEQLTGYIRVWKNAGTATSPSLVAMGDTVRDVDGRAIVADRQNILNAVDIDCNGRLDLFIGRVQGVVDRYEQEGVSPDSSPRFRLLEEMWQGIEVLGPEVSGLPIMRSDTASHEPQALSPELTTRYSQPTTHYLRPTTPFLRPITPSAVPNRRHGANTLTFADLTGRGIYDLFWGDFFEEGLLRFENAGSCAQPDMTAPPARFPPGKPVLTSGYNASTFGDIDGDKNIDMVIGVIGGAYGPSRTSIDNLYVVRQSPKDTWAVTTRRLIPTIDIGADAAPTLGDLNGDGLVDLLIGGKILPNSSTTGSVTWFANVGTATQPAFRERGVLPIRGDFNYAPAIADLNGDSLPDIIVGTWRDRVHWYRNSGTRAQPAWTLADTALVTITRGTNSTPTIGDLDGDGLLDLIVGEASGTINVYKNAGTKTSPAFQLVSDHFQDIKVSRRSAPLLFDMDNDGKLDMVLGAGDGQIQLWRGVGNTGEIRFERDQSFALTSYANAMPAAADLHRNGRTELLVGTAAGGLRWFENRAAR
ncbi:MAG TPA: VCBS repeat-containing protein [Gemmatimonadaceae bacterium]|nr:VCBS repeat-containing protein [Gemmatimonadaceae bacterium]